MGYLDSGDAPPQLYRDATLHIAPMAADAYRAELNRSGLFATARSGTSEKKIHGGPGDDDTRRHFAFRFTNGIGRIALVLLDPSRQLEPLSVDLVETFIAGRIALLDLACGCGATSLGLLATLAEMRRNKCIPTHPLDVSITAADISPLALELFERQMAALQPGLLAVGIAVKLVVMEWNAKHEDVTSDVCDKWLSSAVEGDDRLCIIAALGGVGNQQFDEFQPSFAHLVARRSKHPFRLLWIEPKSDKFVNKVARMFDAISSRMARTIGKLLPTHLEDSASLMCPIQEKVITCRVSVQEYRDRG